MNKQEQIEEMVTHINNAVKDNIELVERQYSTLEAEFRTHGMGINFNAVGFAEAFYNAGYKQEKEVAKEIIAFLKSFEGYADIAAEQLAKQYGIKLEK